MSCVKNDISLPSPLMVISGSLGAGPCFRRSVHQRGRFVHSGNRRFVHRVALPSQLEMRRGRLHVIWEANVVVLEVESADDWETVVSGCFVPLRCAGFESSFIG